jgi:hypothetical protein
MPDVNTNDRDDPNNYVSFDDYVAGSSKVWLLENLASRWNSAHPEAQVYANFGPIVQPGELNAGAVAPVAPPAALDGAAAASGSSGLTRVFAAVQLVGGGLEIIVAGGALLAPEPTGATKLVGVVVLLHGMDTIQSAIRTIVSGDRTVTFTQEGATWVAQSAGAGPQTAETIGVVTDVGVGVAGSFAVGALSRVAPGAAQLVHLTNADAAAAIRGSQTLGLGSSTVYAGPEALASARGWRIVARTGVAPSQATEAILLPRAANSGFLMVQPIGPFSAWQRISGTVYSAGAGSFNLGTGVFTRSGPAINQLAIYGTDMAVMATMRAAPAVMDRMSR